jgi:integrase
VLTDDELKSFWRATEQLGFPFGRAFQLMALTGQRRGEVASMRWSQVNIDQAVWTIPAHVAKNGRAHEVPLSPATLEIIEALPRFVGSDFVLTTTGTTPISGFGRAKDRLDFTMESDEWRLHDLRRTAASGMARIGVAPHVIEKVLNHVSGEISGVAAVYNRHGYDAEKREALERWAKHLSNLKSSSTPKRVSLTFGPQSKNMSKPKTSLASVTLPILSVSAASQSGGHGQNTA